MKKYLFGLLIITAFYSNNVKAQICVTNPASGWTVPAGVTSMTVYCWGGGGGGGGSTATGSDFANGGGGGGGTCAISTLAVVAGQVYTITYGAGGAGGSTTAPGTGGTGGTTTFTGPGGTVSANGGVGGVGSSGVVSATPAGGAGGTTGTGTTIYSGGNGSKGHDGNSATTGITGTGGGGAGSGGNGTTPASACGVTGTGGIGTYPGGTGGYNTNCNTTTSSAGVAGAAYGGGGSGANDWSGTWVGGDGGAGQVVICYNCTCSGTPTGGTAAASVTSGCTGYSSTISLSGNTNCGITYQWYSSPNNITWALISGATSSTYATIVSSSTYYNCVITCTSSGLSGTSSSVLAAVSNCTNISVTNPISGWTVPAGVTSITVYCWGGGGGGGGSTSGADFANGGGGGGGACAISTLAVIAGQVYTITYGAGGAGGSTAGGNGGAGGATTFTGPGGMVSANGGSGGIGSTAVVGAIQAGGTGATTGTGTTIYSGGNGSAGNNGTSSTTGITGTGGGGAGSGGNGTTPASACSVTGTGGIGTYPGGTGGYNTNCNTTVSSAGVAGAAYSGGGSGANDWSGTYLGGTGGTGQVIINYTGPPVGGAALASATSGCVAYASTISLTGSSTACGMTYQWYSSPNNITWTAIAGATSSIYAATVSANTYFECILTCPVSGLSGTSSSVFTPAPGAPTNDACVGAINLGSISTTTTTVGSNLCGTSDQTSPTCFTYNQNVWYKFTVAIGGGSYNVSVSSGTLQYPDIAVFSGTCGAFTQAACATYTSISGTSVSANCLAAGTYYVAVDQYFSGATYSGTFSVTITQTASGLGPANDACASAISLGTVSSTTTTAGNNICGTSDQTSPTCFTYNQNVWYAFTVPAGGGSYQFSVSSGTLQYPSIVVFSGTCGSFNQMACATYNSVSGTSVSSGCFVAGTYYIAVDQYFSGATYSGTFSLTVTQTISGGASPPSNDNCTGAISITLGNCVNGDVSCASSSSVACLGTATSDIWYKFTAASTTQEIQVSASSSFDPVVQVFSGTCAGLTSISCNDASYTTGGTNQCASVGSLIIGNTYWIRVYNYGGVPTTTTFTICLNNSTAYVCNLNYTYSSIAINIEAGVSTVLPGLVDDALSSAVPIGFTFCYDGFMYTQVYVASNNALVFDAVDNCSPNIELTKVPASNLAATGYQILAAAPTAADYTPLNAILGPWHDIDIANGGTVTYATLGTAPNRRFVVYFNGVHQFESSSPCQNAGYAFTGQMKLFETTNNIEIHVQNQKSCTIWNNGQAILGLQNPYGTLAVIPTGYNAVASPGPYNQYSIVNMAWQFITACTGCITILPVELLSFTGVLNGEEVDLKWSTATEQNNDYFTIERSADGTNFEKLTQVKGGGNSNQTLDYSIIDYTPLPEVSYYKLSQTDFNGNVTQLSIISVTNNNDDGMFTALPNPTNGMVNVIYNCNTPTGATLKVYDSNGSLVLTKDFACTNGKNKSQLDLSNIASGIYLVTFSTANKFYRTKLMKE